MGGHNYYIYAGNISQLSYGPFKFSGEPNFINLLRNESLDRLEFFLQFQLVFMPKIIKFPNFSTNFEAVIRVRQMKL